MDEKQLSLNPELDIPHAEYQLLTGHARTDGSFKTSEQLRSEYVQLTDELIMQISDGVEVVDPVTREKRTERPDVVVWLDKSARPVSWLARELWPTLAQKEDGTTPPIPAFRFVNIDRQQWVNMIDPHGTGMVDIDRVDPSVIRSLRSIFVPLPAKREGLGRNIDEASSELDDKTVLIVDEVRSSGRTLEYAKKFFQKAFPTTRLATTYWMKGMTMREGATGNADLPVWYKENDITGRGVSNRNEQVSQRSPSLTQRLGGWFLSTAFEDMDPSSRQLRQEIHQLAEDVKNQNILVVPSLRRDADDFNERATRLNNMAFEEFVAEKRELDTPIKH